MVADSDVRRSEHRVRTEFSKTEITIFWKVLHWMSCSYFSCGGQVFSIQSAKLPSLQTLLDCSTDEWQSTYRPAFEALQADGFFDEQVILGESIEWSPTHNGRAVMADLIGWEILPAIAEEDNGNYNPELQLVGFPCERLAHRTGVEWTYKLFGMTRNETTRYPSFDDQLGFDVTAMERPSNRQNLKARFPGENEHAPTSWGAQIYTREGWHLQDKILTETYRRCCESPHEALWVFQDEELAAEMLRKLHDAPCEFDLVSLAGRQFDSIDWSHLNSVLASVTDQFPGMSAVVTFDQIYENIPTAILDKEKFDWYVGDHLREHDWAFELA